MRKLFVTLTVAATSVFAYADSWSGKLLDASCYDRMKDSSKSYDEACAATSQTTAFVLTSSGKVYRLDAVGNTRAAAAMKNRAERSAPAAPGAALTKDIDARVEGNETAGTITVTTIELQ